MAGFGTGAKFGVHGDNLKNLARGIVERVLYVNRDGGLAKAPQPQEGVFRRLSGVRERLLRVLRSTPVVSRDDYPGLYVGRKKGVYERAVESLKIRGVTRSDAYCSTFLKAEKINFTKKADPAPRVIQPRSPRYNVEIGRYLKLFEKALFSGFESIFGYPVVLKGFNATDVAGWLARHWDGFDAPAAVGLDATRFDQHVSYDALRWEHSVYNAVFRSPELARLLSWQLENRGIARVEGTRVDYQVRGCRMSGDINTGMGNCLLMSSMVIAYCESVGIKFRLANNGDDCVLFVEKRDLPRLDGLDAWMLEFGFTLTREEPVFVLEQVEFCQCHPVLCGTGWRMVRNPNTAMSKDCVSLLSWDTPLDIQTWASAIGNCGLSLTSGVPVWESWYRRLIRMGSDASDGVIERANECGMAYMARGVAGCEVTEESRYSFYLAFGWTPDAQRALEAEYDQPCAFAALTPMTFPDVQTIDSQLNTLATWCAK